MKNNKLQISVYTNHFLNKYGGAQGYTATVIEVLQTLYQETAIAVLTEKFKGTPAISLLDFVNNQNKAYGLKINPEKIILKTINSRDIEIPEKGSKLKKVLFFILRQAYQLQVQKKICQLTKGTDLFFNASVYSVYGSAEKNISIVHFPKNRISDVHINKKIPFLKKTALKADLNFETKTDLFFPNSEFTSYWLSKIWKVPAEKNIVLYPPVTPVSDEIKTKVQKNKNQILICSRINSTKKIHVLIKAFLSSSYLKNNATLVIAGSVKNQGDDYIKQLIAFSAEVKFIFEPDRTELEKLYAQSEIYWHAKGLEETEPLSFEHFGITTVEAMSAGCIPVVINKGGQKEIVDDSCGFKWNTIEELISYTENILKNRNKMEELKTNCIEKSRLYFKDQFIKKFEGLLQNEL